MAIQEKRYTADDLWALSRGDNEKKYELIKGELVPVSPTGESHSATAAWLLHLIWAYVDQHDLGEVTGEAGGYILSRDPETMRAPDVGFVAKARLDFSSTEKYVPFAPDLAVEVISPSETADSINDKIIEYFEAGVPLVWIIYPKTRTIYVYTAVDEVRILKHDGVLDGGEVLPGFSIPVSEVFKKLRA